MVFFIPIKDIKVDLDKNVNLQSLPEKEVISLIKKAYGFLSSSIDVTIDDDVAIITLNEVDKEKRKKAHKLYNDAINEAQKGEYNNAIQKFKKALNILPIHIDSRRNMAMAYLESGNVNKAKEHLLECLNLDPKDTWTYVLLGNIFAKYDRDFVQAENYFEKCLNIDPNDNFLLNNYAALIMQKGDFERAKELFEKAKSIDSTYPNTYYGLAFLYKSQNKPEEAIQMLEDLFSKASSKDIRSVQVFDEARITYLELCKELAESSYNDSMKFILNRKNSLEEKTGFSIQIIEDNSLENISAVAQMAWKKAGRSQHTVRYKNIMPAITPHLVAHELEHISLEHAARNIDRNRHFITTSETREYAIRSVADHINKLSKSGYPHDQITDIIIQLIDGLCHQLYNCAPDMIIEYRLHKNFNELHFSQFVSINKLCIDALRVLSAKDLKKLVPSKIYHDSVALNCVYAIFCDYLFEKKTEYSKPYKSTEAYKTGNQLFELWQSKMATFEAGDEYVIVDDFARILKLENWYQWKKDIPDNNEDQSVAETFQLVGKELETYKYCLEALNRFEGKSDNEILKIASEIGLIGTGGIAPEKTYTLVTLPGETFNGLQILCLMYVGFKKIEPNLDTMLDFDKEYQLALKFFNAKIH